MRKRTEGPKREFSPEKYAALLATTRPQIIENDIEHKRLLAVIEPMMGLEDRLSPEEEKLFDLLVKLIQDYEDRHFPIEPADDANSSLPNENY